MYIVIMNGNPDAGDGAFEDYVASFAGGLEAAGHRATKVDLRELNLKYCIGCWSCWWATPGKCVHRDDMVQLYPELVAADLVVWASPLSLGTVSSLTKLAQDRFIPLIHPYIELVGGECHHRRRYGRLPDVGLLLRPGPGDSPEDLAAARRLWERFALNARSPFSLFATTDKPLEELVHETIAG